MAQKKSHREKEAERKREAQRVINRVERETEQVGSSSMARTANKVRDHFLGEDQPQEDPAEVWGKRIGRALSAIVFVALAIYLFITYVAKS